MSFEEERRDKGKKSKQKSGIGRSSSDDDEFSSEDERFERSKHRKRTVKEIGAETFHEVSDVPRKKPVLPGESTTIPRALASGFVNAWLLTCLCGVYGIVMFEDIWHFKHAALGMKMNLFSGVIQGLGLFFAKGSVVMGGPDIQAAVFYSKAIKKLGVQLAKDAGLPEQSPVVNEQEFLRRLGPVADEDFPESSEADWLLGEIAISDDAETLARRAQGLSLSFSGHELSVAQAYELGEQTASSVKSSVKRRLQVEEGGATNSTDEDLGIEADAWCRGLHHKQRAASCNLYHDKLRATVTAAVAIGTGGIGLVYLLLALAKGTRYVHFIPRCISDAFLACVGYQVTVHAIRFCNNDPAMFMIAAAIGVPFYFCISAPFYPFFTVPLFILVAIGSTTGVEMIKGQSVAAGREAGVYFPFVGDEQFFAVFTEGWIYKSDLVEWSALTLMMPDIAAMWGVMLIDGLGQIRLTEDKCCGAIHAEADVGYIGVCNLVAAPFGGMPGCSQMTLNIINWGITNDNKNRYATIVVGLLMTILGVVPGVWMNWFPRVFYATFLFSSATRFVSEHLWQSRKYLTSSEWLTIIVIVGLYVVYGDTDSGFAVVLFVGLLITAQNFIAKYSNVPCLDGVPLHGGELASRERHGPLMTKSLAHIANSWVLVLRLKGFCFFASVRHVIAHVRETIQKQVDDDIPPFRRIKYLVFDCDMLDGIDSAASKDFASLRDEALENHIHVVWTAVKDDVLKTAKKRGTINQYTEIFRDLGEAMLWFEEHIREFRHHIEERWVALHPLFKETQEMARLRDNFEPFKFIFAFDAARFGSPWMYCSKKNLRAAAGDHSVLWEPGSDVTELFLIHTGAVGIFKDLPVKGEYCPPEAIYKHGFFVNREFLTREGTVGYGVAMEDGECLTWNTHQWWKMQRERPLMAAAIIEMAMRQAHHDQQILSAQVDLHDDVHLDEDGGLDMSHMDLQEADLMVHDVPHELQTRIEGIEAAQFLKDFKLYDAIGEDDLASALPELPQKLKNDLMVAFITYASNNGSGRGARPSLAGEKLREALMYAGIFHNIDGAKMNRSFDQNEFIAVGHEAAMSRLSKKQVSRIYNIFKSYDKDRSGLLDRDEMVIIFRETFSPNISEEEVNGLLGAWDDNGSGTIDAKEWVGIIARFIRKHEQDWHLLIAMREIMQKRKQDPISIHDVLTVDMLMDNTRLELTETEAEEMLWACDCFDCKADGKELDFPGLVAGVLLSTEYKFGKLPPLPKKVLSKVEQRKEAEKAKANSAGKASTNDGKKAPKRKSTWPAANDGSDDESKTKTNRKTSSENDSDSDDEEDNAKRDYRNDPKKLRNDLLNYRDDEKAKENERKSGCKASVWMFFNEPHSSVPAHVFALSMSALIFASFGQLVYTSFFAASRSLEFCPQNAKYPYYKGKWCCSVQYEKVNVVQLRSCDGSIFGKDGIVSKCCKSGMQKKCKSETCSQYDPQDDFYDMINLVIGSIWTVEYVMRLLFCDGVTYYDGPCDPVLFKTFVAFILNPLSLCDLGAVVPFWYFYIFGGEDLAVFRLLKLARTLSVKNAPGHISGPIERCFHRMNWIVPSGVMMVLIWAVYWRENNPQDQPDVSALR